MFLNYQAEFLGAFSFTGNYEKISLPALNTNLNWGSEELKNIWLFIPSSSAHKLKASLSKFFSKQEVLELTKSEESQFEICETGYFDERNVNFVEVAFENEEKEELRITFENLDDTSRLNIFFSLEDAKKMLIGLNRILPFIDKENEGR